MGRKVESTNARATSILQKILFKSTFGIKAKERGSQLRVGEWKRKGTVC